MKRAEVRLELLKLCHRHDLSPEQIIPRMKEFEDHIFEGQELDSEPPRRKPGRPKKDVNPENLS